VTPPEENAEQVRRRIADYEKLLGELAGRTDEIAVKMVVAIQSNLAVAKKKLQRLEIKAVR
jgi:hypothetical protein